MEPPVRRAVAPTARGYTFEISGGHLALDLANTVDLRPTPEARELLSDWPALVGWSVQAGAVDAATGRRLGRDGTRQPEAAAAVLRRARVLREALFTIFSSVARTRPVPADALAALNAAVPGALVRRRVAPCRSRRKRPVAGAASIPDGDGAFAWAWEHPVDALDVMLPPVALAASELLCTPELLERVRVCASSDRCNWLFLDLSRNASRRWCDMTVCGNRAKARRHYQKMAAARGAPRSSPPLALDHSADAAGKRGRR